MINSFIVFLVALFVVNAHAQNTWGQRSNKRMLMATFGPGMVYRNLNYSKSEKWIEHLRDNNEKPKTGYTAGILLVKPIEGNIHARIGLQFSNHGQRTDRKPLQWSSDAEGFPDYAIVKVSHHSLAVPAELYLLISQSEKLQVFGFAGLNPNVLVNTTTVTTAFSDEKKVSHNRSGKNTGYKRFGISASGGADVLFNLTDRNAIMSGISFHYSITSRLISSNAAERPYGVFLNLGFTRRF